MGSLDGLGLATIRLFVMGTCTHTSEKRRVKTRLLVTQSKMDSMCGNILPEISSILAFDSSIFVGLIQGNYFAETVSI